MVANGLSEDKDVEHLHAGARALVHARGAGGADRAAGGGAGGAAERPAAARLERLKREVAGDPAAGTRRSRQAQGGRGQTRPASQDEIYAPSFPHYGWPPRRRMLNHSL